MLKTKNNIFIAVVVCLTKLDLLQKITAYVKLLHELQPRHKQGEMYDLDIHMLREDYRRAEWWLSNPSVIMTMD